MTDTPRPQIVIATSDATVMVNGVEVKVRKDSSTATPGDQIVVENPDLWRDFVGHYEDADADVGDPEPVDEHPPAAKDVRAWATANSIDVPARGPIPDDVVERYKAAHG